jgi:hypothetical protein
MGNSSTVRISDDLRALLDNSRKHKRESYDMILKRKLMEKRSRKNTLKAKLAVPDFKPNKATKKVLGSDKKVTKDFMKFP